MTLIVCPRCQGDGESYDRPQTGYRHGEPSGAGAGRCPECDGAGRIADRRQPTGLRPTGFLYLILAAMLAAGFLAGRVSAAPPAADQQVSPGAGVPGGVERTDDSAVVAGRRPGAPQATGLETPAPLIRSGVASWFL